MPIQNTNAILNTAVEEYQPYTLVRSGVFHYIDVIDDEKNIFTSNSKLESVPNVVYYTENSDTKIMLDYSLASEKDKKYLSILCKDLNQFSGLSLTNAIYLNELEGINNKSLTTSFLFSEFKNNILFGKVLSSVDAGDLNKAFLNDYFVDIPVLTTDSLWSAKTAKITSSIINSNPKGEINFDNFLITSGDLVELINPNSSNTQKRFEVESYSTINNKQIIKLKTPAIPENLIGQSTVLNIYTKTKLKDLKSLNIDNTVLGCCQDLKSRIVYDSTTEYECHIRTNGYYVHSKNVKCNDLVNQTLPTNISINSNVVQLKKVEFLLYSKEDLIELDISIKDRMFMINGEEFTNYPLQIGKIYKFVQNDESNLGYPLRLTRSITNANIEPDYYQRDLFGTMRPEGVGTELYLKVTANTAAILQFFTENDLTVKSPTLLIVS
jgi:hypothetical protein